MSRPLLRWTVGNCSELGLEILEESIKRIRGLYPRLDLILCYNHDSIPERTRHFNVDLYKQSHCKEMEYLPLNEIWKLYPPRLNINSHEIFMDNDIVLFKKCPQIDKYLESSDHALLYEGIHGLHGKYAHLIKDQKFNSGIFGLPPKFDFSAAIRQVQQEDKIRKWEFRWDDQGIVGSVLSGMPHFLISQKQIPCWDYSNAPISRNIKSECVGIHFIESNSIESNVAWHNFKQISSNQTYFNRLIKKIYI